MSENTPGSWQNTSSPLSKAPSIPAPTATFGGKAWTFAKIGGKFLIKASIALPLITEAGTIGLEKLGWFGYQDRGDSIIPRLALSIPQSYDEIAKTGYNIVTGAQNGTFVDWGAWYENRDNTHLYKLNIKRAVTDLEYAAAITAPEKAVEQMGEKIKALQHLRTIVNSPDMSLELGSFSWGTEKRKPLTEAQKTALSAEIDKHFATETLTGSLPFKAYEVKRAVDNFSGYNAGDIPGTIEKLQGVFKVHDERNAALSQNSNFAQYADKIVINKLAPGWKDFKTASVTKLHEEWQRTREQAQTTNDLLALKDLEERSKKLEAQLRTISSLNDSPALKTEANAAPHIDGILQNFKASAPAAGTALPAPAPDPFAQARQRVTESYSDTQAAQDIERIKVLIQNGQPTDLKTAKDQIKVLEESIQKSRVITDKTALGNQITGLNQQVVQTQAVYARTFLNGVTPGQPLDVGAATAALPFLADVIKTDPSLRGIDTAAQNAYRTIYGKLEGLKTAVETGVTDTALKNDLKNKITEAGAALSQTDYGRELVRQEGARRQAAEAQRQQDNARATAAGEAALHSSNPLHELLGGNSNTAGSAMNVITGAYNESVKYGSPLLKRWTNADEVGGTAAGLTKLGLGAGVMIVAQSFLNTTGWVQNGFMRLLLSGVAAWIGLNLMASTGVITDWTKTNSFQNNNNSPLNFGSALGVGTANAAGVVQSSIPAAAGGQAAAAAPASHLPAVLPASGSDFTNLNNKPGKLRVAFNAAAGGSQQGFDIENGTTVRQIAERVIQVQQVSGNGQTAQTPAPYVQVAIVQETTDGTLKPNIVTLDINKALGGADPAQAAASQGPGNLPDNVANMAAGALFQSNSGLKNGAIVNDGSYIPQDVLETYFKSPPAAPAGAPAPAPAP